jgi:hypothetical protein
MSCAACGFSVDALLTEVQGKIALTLYRAAALAATSTMLLPEVTAFPFDDRGAEILQSLNGTPVSLWDGTVQIPDAGGAGSGYLEGYVPSTQTYLTNKPTRANALVYAALRHEQIDDVSGAPHAGQIPVLRQLFTDQLNPQRGLLELFASQTAYVHGGTRNFDVLQLPADAGPDPSATIYEAEAIDDGVEAMSEYWYGLQR